VSLRAAEAEQVTLVAVPQATVTEVIGGVLQPVKLAAAAFAQTRQVALPVSPEVVSLTCVVEFV